ncbi:hypothetical protein CMI38_05705 [Candidatus Pacearchaeota archaeon]|nr:hypothetical protein [Candidatus Pacearchaeota archaeon]
MSEEHGHGHHEHHSHGKNETVTFKKETLWKAGTFIFAALFVITLLMNGGVDLGNIGSEGGNGEGDAPAPTVPPKTENIKITLDDSDPVLGDKNADITVVEFSDFQCPFCQRAADGAVAEFKQSDYFKNGDVNFVFKHLPLDNTCNSGMSRQLHPNACKSAEASICAQKQGKFWEYHDVLFANQGALDVSSLKSYASQIGLDTSKFNSCLDKGDSLGKITNDLKQATDAGGSGTPYFVVYNKKTKKGEGAISGACPYSTFSTVFDAIKDGKKWSVQNCAPTVY